MTRLYMLLFLGFLLSCRIDTTYSIEKEKNILSDNKQCELISFYPVIHSKNDTTGLLKLNKSLEEINEMDRFRNNCSRFVDSQYLNKNIEVIGDYDVLFKTDTLLNIEYFVQSKYFKKIEYRNVFVDLVGKELVEPNRAIPNIDRSRLYPYVRKFSDSTGIKINLKAYEQNSNYTIMFGRTQKDLILYLGKEGEFGGYYKLFIPIEKVIK